MTKSIAIALYLAVGFFIGIGLSIAVHDDLKGKGFAQWAVLMAMATTLWPGIIFYWMFLCK